MKSKERKLIRRVLGKALLEFQQLSVSSLIQGHEHINHLTDLVHKALNETDTIYTEDSLWEYELNLIRAYRPHCIGRTIEDSKFKELSFEFLEPDDVIRFKTVFGTVVVDADNPQKLWKTLKVESGDGVTRIHISR